MSNHDSVEAALQAYVDEGALAGAATLVWRNGRVVQTAALGRRDLVTNLPVERDTIFRRHAPELAGLRVLRDPNGPLDQTDAAERPITFRDLLTHRSGLTYGEFHRGPIARACADALGGQIDNALSPDEWIARLATLPLIDQPGAGFHYGQSNDLLGFIIARVEGVSLGHVLEQRVFTPLGMRDTGFIVPREKRTRRAGLCGFDAEGHLTPLTTTPGRHALGERPDDMTFEAGGGGLWSTLDDYLAFARIFLGGGEVDGVRLLRPETCAMMASNQLTSDQRRTARMLGMPVFAAGHGYGMGVAVLMEPDKADPLRCRGGVGTVGWPGAYGSWWQADPSDNSVLIFLTHNMLELQQMARGIGPEAWSAIAKFYELASA